MYSGVLKMMATCLKTLIWLDCNSACHISPLSCSLKNTTEMSPVNRSYNSLVTCKTIKAHYIVSDVHRFTYDGRLTLNMSRDKFFFKKAHHLGVSGVRPLPSPKKFFEIYSSQNIQGEQIVA